MKLLLASRGDFDNPKIWSGTQYNLKRAFQAEGGVQTLNWQLNRQLLRAYHAGFLRFFFGWGTSRDPLLQRFAEKKIKRLLIRNDKPPDFLLFISDYYIPDRLRGYTKYAAYFDSFLKEQFKYMDDARWGKDWFFRGYEKSNQAQLERMTLIFTQNEWTRQCIISEYGIPGARIHNVGFGINVTPFDGEKDYDKELLLIVQRKGTEKYKGLLLLLDAFKILKRRQTKVRLAVVGTQLPDKLDGVEYFYNFPRSKTVELFRASTLYVMPALHEPNGITYLEALANKTPIVGLNRFAVPEFSGNGKWGFMADDGAPEELADVIYKALSDKNRLQEMGLKGQQFVLSRYRWDLVVNQMLKEMQKVACHSEA
ncbi:glycosyltransferase family 4 protein [Desulfatiglans anilini]|uniref:glycosyltransferase family 4 protein n=1 Tax=Desulfatiglans anilini TaxID=90728 RepID=UPI00041BEA0C|nr:glycosyltransferase family 4 protein [Desulfatiglans anilini]